MRREYALACGCALALAAATLAERPATPTPRKRPAGPWRKAWRIFYTCLVIWGAWGIIQMLRAAPAPQVAVSPEAARSAEQKLSALAVALPPSSSEAQPPSIRLTQEEVDSFLAAHFPQAAGAGGAAAASQGGNSVRGVTVTFAGDRAHIFIVFRLAVKDVTLQLAGRLHVVDGYLRYEITDGSLGYLTLPGWALDQGLAPFITDAEVRNHLRVPADIRDVRVENGELVIERQ